ncbi:MAG: extracellular solute-binding protein [Acidobacteriaceae bacterium]
MSVRLRLLLRQYSDFESAVQAEIDLFRREHPEIEVEAEPLELHTLYERLFVSGDLRDGKCDLALVVTDWLCEAVEKELLEDLAPWMRTRPLAGWPEAWPVSLTEPVCFGERICSLPWHDGPECLIYRRDYLENPPEGAAFRNQYGYNLAPPRTWSQLRDVTRFFTRPEQERWGTVVAAFPDGHNTLYDFALQLWSRGGSLHDATGRPTIDTRAATEALDFYRELVCDPSRCHPDSPHLDSTRSGDLFLSGNIALMVNWFGFAARADRPGSPLEGRIAIAPLPAEPGRRPASLSVFWTMGIAAGSKNKAAAWEFLRFIARPAIDRARVDHGTVGVQLATWRDPALQRRIPCYAAIEEISLGAMRLPRSRHLPAFAEVIDKVIVDALTGDDPSSAILERAQRELAHMNLIFAEGL